MCRPPPSTQFNLTARLRLAFPDQRRAARTCTSAMRTHLLAADMGHPRPPNLALADPPAKQLEHAVGNAPCEGPADLVAIGPVAPTAPLLAPMATKPFESLWAFNRLFHRCSTASMPRRRRRQPRTPRTTCMMQLFLCAAAEWRRCSPARRRREQDDRLRPPSCAVRACSKTVHECWRPMDS